MARDDRWKRWDRWEPWPKYVSAAERRARAARELEKRAKKGLVASPVAVEGRNIAKTFWGRAWCENLEHYSDFANRLPRGRTYVRNGSVVDLKIQPGVVTSLVSGTELYDVKIQVAPVPTTHWRTLCKNCAGTVDSLVELLQGRFSRAVMSRICEPRTGLFPSPREIQFTCSCPDSASMCKHIAAVLYGIGARLDQQPELLFLLRSVDHQELIAHAGKELPGAKERPHRVKVLKVDNLSEIFGIEIAEMPENRPGLKKAVKAKPRPRSKTTLVRKRNG
jgi:uncharacterized Zn finger protein